MATVQSNMFEQIQQELSCSICLELFTRPKVLPCQHTFCQDCLQDHAGRGGTFQCPNCRQKINPPQKGVASFPTNNLVANLCDTLHKRKKEFKDKDQSKVKCPHHCSNDIDLYCNRCQEPVCVECLGESHKGHSATSVKTAAQEKTASTVKLIAEAQNIADTYFYNFLLDSTNRETILNELKQKRDEELDTALANAVQHLKETKASLQCKDDQEHIKNIKDLQTQKNEVSDFITEITRAWTAAEKGVEKGGLELLYTEASLLKVVEKFRGKSVLTPKSVQTVEFQPTDPKTLTLGQFSSCKKQSWLWKMVRIMLLLLQASILAIWWVGFLLAGGLYFIGLMTNYKKLPFDFVVITAILFGIFFSISLYWLFYQGKKKFLLPSLLLFAICHASWLGLILWGLIHEKRYVDAVLTSTAAILSCLIIIAFIWKNN